jgi:hypothetical protein
MNGALADIDHLYHWGYWSVYSATVVTTTEFFLTLLLAIRITQIL